MCGAAAVGGGGVSGIVGAPVSGGGRVSGIGGATKLGGGVSGIAGVEPPCGTGGGIFCELWPVCGTVGATRPWVGPEVDGTIFGLESGFLETSFCDFELLLAKPSTPITVYKYINLPLLVFLGAEEGATFVFVGDVAAGVTGGEFMVGFKGGVAVGVVVVGETEGDGTFGSNRKHKTKWLESIEKNVEKFRNKLKLAGPHFRTSG